MIIDDKGAFPRHISSIAELAFGNPNFPNQASQLLIRNFHFELPLHPKTVCRLPCRVKRKSPGPLWRCKAARLGRPASPLILLRLTTAENLKLPSLLFC